MSTSRETRVALVGAGYVSAYHIRALQTLPHIRIVGIADTSVAQARAVAERFAISGVFASLSEMRDARPDVVHILTPPASHASLAVEALEMGCDVFVEKPMAPTTAECDEMIAAATRTGRTLSVNHSAKDDPAVVRALELVRRGVCGDVLAVDFHRTSDYPPYAGGALPAAFRQGGYPFLDMGVHALYLMEAFLGPIRNLDVRVPGRLARTRTYSLMNGAAPSDARRARAHSICRGRRDRSATSSPFTGRPATSTLIVFFRPALCVGRSPAPSRSPPASAL